MFYYLSQYSDWVGPLNVFQYVTFRVIGSALFTLLMSFLVGPSVIRILTRLKLGQPIRGKDEVHALADLHGGKKGTPTMGGVMILITLTAGCLLWAKPTSPYVWMALIPTLLLGVLGFVDDYSKIRQKKSDGISSRQKLAGQFIVAIGVALFFVMNESTRTSACVLQIPYIKAEMSTMTLAWFLAIPFFAVTIVGSSNAVNLTDGLDGLAIGCTIPVALVYMIFAYVTGHADFSQYLRLVYLPGTEELAVFCAALGGAALGFLWFNCHPAKMFMGDTGSLAIGGALAVVAICLNQELLLVVVGGVFVMEAMSVILQVASFKLTGKRIFAMSPIHHHFELKGWSETTVVTRFWIMGLISAMAGLASLKLR